MEDLIDDLLSMGGDDRPFPPPGDFHSRNAVAFFGMKKSREMYFKDPRRYKEEIRALGKVAGLALVYGSGARAFQGWIKGCTEARGQELYDRFFKELPKLKQWGDNTLKRAKDNGFILTMLGRRIYIEGLKGTDWKAKFRSERHVKNYPIQGSGAEIIKYMLVDVYKYIEEHALNRWYGTYTYRDYYTRIFTVEDSLLNRNTLEILEGQPSGNCKIIVIDSNGNPVQEFDRPVQLTVDLVKSCKLKLFF